MVSGTLQQRLVGSGAMPGLKALLHVQTVQLRVWKMVSFILEGSKVREKTL
jgi:hypothetical protein